ncbi:MAG: hypothetical protein RL308_121 [Bacteroidota bacterium]|jgi:hypothetical protein
MNLDIKEGLKFIENNPDLRAFQLSDDLLYHWSYHMFNDYVIFSTEQWLIFNRAFELFRKKRVAGEINMDIFNYLKLFEMWQGHLYMITFSRLDNICTCDVPVFPFEYLIEELSKKHDYSLRRGKLYLKYNKLGKMVMKP